MMEMKRVYEKNLVEIYEISPRLYFRKADLMTRGQCNGAYFVSGGRVGAVDVPTLEGAEEMMAEARSLFGRDIDYVFLTHGHEDHCGGLPAFLDRDVTVFCSERLLDQVIPRYTDVRASFVGVDGTTTLRVAGMEVECEALSGTAHSPWDMLIRFPGEKALCTGDVAGDLEFLHFHNANIENWLGHLSRLASRSENLIIPGHGDVYAYSRIAETADFVEILKGIASDLLSGLSRERIAAISEKEINEIVESFLANHSPRAGLVKDTAKSGALRELRMVLRYLLYKELK